MKTLKMLFCTFCAAVIFFTASVNAQGWQQIWGTLPKFNAVSAIDDSTCWFAGERNFVVLITNGSTVKYCENGLDPGDESAIHGRSKLLAWVGSVDGKLYKTTDGGDSWVKQFQHPAGMYAFFDGIHFWDNLTGIAWGDPTSLNLDPFIIMRTTDGGTTWNEIRDGVPIIPGLWSITDHQDAVGDHFWFSTCSNYDSTAARYIFRTRDRGAAWDTLGIPANFGEFHLAFSDQMNGLIVGYSNKIARTTDGGKTWVLRRNGVGYGPLKFEKGTGNVWIQGYYDESLGYYPIYLSTDYGDTWTKQSMPTGVQIISFSVVDSRNVWACGFDYLILHTRSGGGPTSMQSHNGISTVPISFELDQNFPNPFNPVTRIKYRLNKTGATRLVVYDVMGRHVRTLMNSVEQAGWHLLVWDGLNDDGQTVPTGTYFYRIENNGVAETKKMIYLK